MTTAIGLLLSLASLCGVRAASGLPAQNPAAEGPSGTAAAPSNAATALPPATRGTKLVLKDGSFQLVRSYEQHGQKVRYLSAERGDWEELPAALVDWDATARAAEADKAAATNLVSNVHHQETERQATIPIDVDESLRVGGGAFLPSGEGMFAVQGKSVTKLEQVGAQTKVDKKRAIEQVLSPVPLVPSKHRVVLAGARAGVRITASGAPLEFFLREMRPDPGVETTVVRSTNAGDTDPEVELLRATVKGGKRELEAITSLFGEQKDVVRKTISIQRWDVAPEVFRFTLSEVLPPGEYVLAEILPDGLNLFVWDFGVDAAADAKPGS
jgi:hypothetical protein